MSDGVEQFHEVLRAAVITRGLSLERIAAHLRARGHTVSIATLSYWQSGRSLPSRATSLRALGALETVLGIPRGALARLAPLPPGQDTASAPKPALTDILRQRSRIDEVLASMGRSLDAGVDLVANHTCAYVDQSGQVPSVLCREVLVATDDRVDSYLLAAGHPVSGIDVVFTPVSGCRMHGHIADAADSWGIADMALPPCAAARSASSNTRWAFRGCPCRAWSGRTPSSGWSRRFARSISR